MIDNRTQHQTPEGILLTLMPAGLVVRGFAWLVDFLLRFFLCLSLLLVFSFFGEVGYGLSMLAYFFVVWLYPVLFEVLWGGQTIGKRMFNIQVCMDNGMPIGWQASMVRNLLLVADFLPLGFFAGIVSMLFSGNAKRLGDHVAGTMVVYVTDKATDRPMSNEPPVPLPMVLSLEEQQAVLSFAERYEDLPVVRRQELAEILSPLTKDHAPNQVIGQAILGYAQTIIGDTSHHKERS